MQTSSVYARNGAVNQPATPPQAVWLRRMLAQREAERAPRRALEKSLGRDLVNSIFGHKTVTREDAQPYLDATREEVEAFLTDHERLRREFCRGCVTPGSYLSFADWRRDHRDYRSLAKQLRERDEEAARDREILAEQARFERVTDLWIEWRAELGEWRGPIVDGRITFVREIGGKQLISTRHLDADELDALIRMIDAGEV